MKKALLQVLASVFVLGMTAIPGFSQETAGQILSRLEKLPFEKRQAALAERAKVEKEVTFYSSLQASDSEPFTKAFNKRYPFIRVNTYRISGQKQVIRIQTEMNAGQHMVDVTNGSSAQAFAIKKIGALDPYHSPQREFFSTLHKDKEGYFTPTYMNPVVLGYNTKLLKRAEVPRSYQELLDPKWKGQLILDTEEFPWFAVLMKHLGKDKGLEYMRRLAKQDILMARGRTAQVQLILAGERSVGFALNSSSVIDFKTQGAPIDWTILDPYYAKPNMMMLARHAPHPHAAALLIDWTLSEEGQSMMAKLGYIVARRGIKQTTPALLEKDAILADPDFIGPILDDASREFRKIFISGS
jgi:iron(III) transport system substrate-binding protein